MAIRETGTVKTWNEKGFGFIERDGMGDSIFVHARDTADRQALIPSSKVSFIYEADEKGGKAKEVSIEEMAEAVVSDEGPRETGTIKRWNADKGFGFIGRANREADAFFHKRSFSGHDDPYVGQAVSFVYGEGLKGAVATKVKVEEGGSAIQEAPVEDEGDREMGTVKRWNAEKGFGFIGRVSGEEDAFFHKKSFAGSDEPYVGQAVSFVFEEGPKGAAAVKVKEEEGGVAKEEEEEGGREMGKVKTYNEEKGFSFIARCFDGTEIFGHKREFLQDIEPYIGQPVSFVYEVTEKGGTAKKIREEDGVPDIPFSDEGRDFGTIKNFNAEKGFGFIVARKGGEEVRFFDKALNDVVPEKNTCVSFVREEGDKGPLAKDLRKEDPDRVARVTARVHYGKVVIYKDPPSSKPDSGYGFIVELDQLTVKKPKKHYFHMWEIETPDDAGGIDPETMVSFIIIPAKKGFQAAAVTIADPPKEEETTQENEAPWGTAAEDNETPLETAMEEMHVSEANETTADATRGDWGSGGW
ncbi:hypothetical protein HO173_011097 [Letharia columbiana]|uniref:CSD domain-containing protein n=1 Tax=Letharia columbiana TaxID=112416 RepID=A0A8H6FL57_9LECA|nr:uncharacterized protein HO173_011097 [Letharia columbiana]KAF6230560.1 hypothetical protein HO173_011097 [Letharia columbiana]